MKRCIVIAVLVLVMGSWHFSSNRVEKISDLNEIILKSHMSSGWLLKNLDVASSPRDGRIWMQKGNPPVVVGGWYASMKAKDVELIGKDNQSRISDLIDCMLRERACCFSDNGRFVIIRKNRFLMSGRIYAYSPKPLSGNVLKSTGNARFVAHQIGMGWYELR